MFIQPSLVPPTWQEFNSLFKEPDLIKRYNKYSDIKIDLKYDIDGYIVGVNRKDSRDRSIYNFKINDIWYSLRVTYNHENHLELFMSSGKDCKSGRVIFWEHISRDDKRYSIEFESFMLQYKEKTPNTVSVEVYGKLDKKGYNCWFFKSIYALIEHYYGIYADEISAISNILNRYLAYNISHIIIDMIILNL